MKTRIFKTRSLGLLLSLPLIGGCNPQAGETFQSPAGTNTPPAAQSTNVALDSMSDDLADDASDATPAPPPDGVKAVPSDVSLSAAAAEVAKLAQAGVGEEVMVSYVNNSPANFHLGSPEIIYLNDLGVSDAVVKAMIQRDQTLAASAGPTVSIAPAPTAPPPASDTTYTEMPADETPIYDNPPPVEAPPIIVNNNYFYNDLSPYGSWVRVDGYGWCWQPTVVILNHGWQPYCDRGRWIYTDCGWYWHSDYTWGSVAFHYGRWFNDSHRGWCWYPDRTWAPAWVSWRYNDSYCGWAPLSPAARFNARTGLTFRAGFGDVSVSAYTVVPWRALSDPHPFRHRLPSQQTSGFFTTTTPVNNITVGDDHRRAFNRGVPPERVAEITHREVPRFNIRESGSSPAPGRRGEHFDRNNHMLFVDRPPGSGNANLIPAPVTGQPPRSPNWHRPETSAAPAPATPTGAAAVNTHPGNRVTPSTAPAQSFNRGPNNSAAVQNDPPRENLPTRPTRLTPQPSVLNGNNPGPSERAYTPSPVMRQAPQQYVVENQAPAPEPAAPPRSSVVVIGQQSSSRPTWQNSPGAPPRRSMPAQEANASAPDLAPSAPIVRSEPQQTFTTPSPIVRSDPPRTYKFQNTAPSSEARYSTPPPRTYSPPASAYTPPAVTSAPRVEQHAPVYTPPVQSTPPRYTPPPQPQAPARFAPAPQPQAPPRYTPPPQQPAPAPSAPAPSRDSNSGRSGKDQDKRSN